MLVGFMRCEETNSSTRAPLCTSRDDGFYGMFNYPGRVQPEICVRFAQTKSHIKARKLCLKKNWGNPVRSELVTQYLAFTTGEQKQAGVLVKQAPAILHGYLETIVRSMRSKLQSTVFILERVTLARDIAFLAVAFSTTKRAAELTNILIQRVIRLPNKSGLLFNFQWGNVFRDGADHLISVPYDEKYVAVSPVRVVEKWIAVGQATGWDMTSGYLFFEISTRSHGRPVKGSLPISATKMSTKCKEYARTAAETQNFSLHSFRSGGVYSRALAGDSLSTIMQRSYWKSPKTAWKYVRLMDVRSSGIRGNGGGRGSYISPVRNVQRFSS